MQVIRVLVSAAAAALLIGVAPLPAASPVTHATIDVPRGKTVQQVIVQTRDFAPESNSGWHTHHGTEIAYLMSGEMEFRVAGNPVQRQHPGESITLPAGLAHMGTSVGTEPARLVITLVVEKGKPLREPVSAPKGQ